MNIYFKLPSELSEIIDKNLNKIIKNIESLHLPPESIALLRLIKEFVKARLQAIKDEIDNEESNSENELYILVDMTTPDGNFKLIPFGYSEHLCQEIQFCIRKSDFENLEKLFLQLKKDSLN